MAYTITINSTNRTTDIISGSVIIEDVINDEKNTCKFGLIDLSENGMPAPGQEITIVDDNGTTIFGGFVIKVSLGEKQKSGVVVASISCLDYEWLFDRNLVHKTYEDMTDKAIIEDIVSTYCPGSDLTTANVVEGVTVDQISFNYIQPSQCLRQICDLTGRNWYIDYDKDIHYFPLTTNPAPFDISDLDEAIIDNIYTGTTIGDLLNDAAAEEATFGSLPGYWDSEADTVVLNTGNNSNGQVEYTRNTDGDFSMTGYILVGEECENEGVYFYWGFATTPQATSDNGGYLVMFSENSGNVEIYFDGSLVTSAAITESTLNNGGFHLIKVTKTGTNLKAYVDDVLYINYTDTERALAGTKMGVGAYSGVTNALHYLIFFHYTVIATEYSNLYISKDASQLKNRIYVRGGTKLSDPTVYAEKGDGEKTVFVLPDKPHDISVEVNGSPETVGIKNIDTSGFDWYVNFQEKYIEQDSGGSVLTTSDTLSVTYSYEIPVLVAVEDTDSIIEYGQKEFAIFDKSITTTQAARDRASAEITDYGNNIIEGSFVTHETGFVSGQYIHITLSEYDIDDDYIVQRVVSRSFGGGNFEYNVSLASSKTMGIIRFLIELLEANKNLIEIDNNEVVDELLSITDQFLSDSLEEDLTIDSMGAYATWCTDSAQSSPITRARYNLFQWG